ncbi:hypothetical protein MM300_22330 [Evansella sp. LMS18]|uniref:tyrosine-protein phosphatase n=1 Tax=Evansella sp. LMS18 TaxID=2924033 RepID=UPI0020CFF515|nr:CpsB/CapC family capsule biosynthesis tyrosine phosphatase [Evansella sp. LMS18]UTR10567.1 hypothetical protein MM300_22330 [Evansella sp. LMS18]
MLVDIHNHILPGLDDGPKNWEETIMLAKQAAETGITHVIATPHHKHKHGGHYYVNEPENINILTEKANKLIKKHGINLSIHPGIEFHIHRDILADLEEKPGDFLTLNNTLKYMLIEPPCSYYPEHTMDLSLRLKQKGIIPVLAHPERNKIIRRNPEIVYELVSEGVLIQVTADSITGSGRRLKNFSHHLLDHNLVHFIASDAHHYVKRKFKLVSAYEYIGVNYSSGYREYLERNAVHLLKGTDIKPFHPLSIGKRRQYFFLYNHPLNKIKA